MRLVLAAALALPVPALAEPVELLHSVPNKVFVSSNVESKTIEPKHLVDGDRNTAWNSERGQLVGAWIEFSVPAAVTVDEIKLIVGHTGKGKEGDYFPMNHRIKRLRVLRDGKKLVDANLDPNNRELQAIPIGQLGGTYRLQVLATTPGTKKSWRELAVSELEVWGTLPAGMTARHHEVRVRVAGGITTHWDDLPAFERAHGKPQPFDALCKSTNCRAADMKKLTPKDSKMKTVAVETLAKFSYARIFVETAAGWYFVGATEIGAYSQSHAAVVEQLEMKDGFALITVDFRAESGGDHARLFTLCGVASDGTPACLNDNVPLEVVHTKYDVHTQMTVSIGNGYLSIDRGKAMKAWENIIGDYKLAP